MDNQNVNQIAIGTGLPTTNSETERKKLKRIQIPRSVTPPPPPSIPEKFVGPSEQLKQLSEMLEADPDNPELDRQFIHTLRTLLDRDAFLDYQFQSERFYRVRTGTGLSINVPKERAVTPPYPAAESIALRFSVRLFRLALLGLVLAGVPTFFLAPIIMWRLLVALLMQPLTPPEKVQATTLMFSSFILFCVASGLSVLLVVHLVA